MSSWVRVAAVADCDVGTLKGVMVEGTPVVLANVDGDIFAQSTVPYPVIKMTVVCG